MFRQECSGKVALHHFVDIFTWFKLKSEGDQLFRERHRFESFARLIGSVDQNGFVLIGRSCLVSTVLSYLRLLYWYHFLQSAGYVSISHSNDLHKANAVKSMYPKHSQPHRRPDHLSCFWHCLLSIEPELQLSDLGRMDRQESPITPCNWWDHRHSLQSQSHQSQDLLETPTYVRLKFFAEGNGFMAFGVMALFDHFIHSWIWMIWLGRDFEKAPPIRGSFKDVQIKSRTIEVTRTLDIATICNCSKSMWQQCMWQCIFRPIFSIRDDIILAANEGWDWWLIDWCDNAGEATRCNSVGLFLVPYCQELSEAVVQWLGSPGAWQLATVCNWPLTPEALLRPTTLRPKRQELEKKGRQLLEAKTWKHGSETY